MNIKNNKRRQATRERIENVFVDLLQTREISRITVADICKRAAINRSTFYANYADIYALADAIRDQLEQEVSALYGGDMQVGYDYRRLFDHIRDNQRFYNTYFKLGYDSTHPVDLELSAANQSLFPAADMPYHIAFHKAGLNAIIKKWLAGGCQEPPDTMVAILQDEYTNRR